VGSASGTLVRVAVGGSGLGLHIEPSDSIMTADRAKVSLRFLIFSLGFSCVAKAPSVAGGGGVVAVEQLTEV
jgi:hypothetical protein